MFHWMMESLPRAYLLRKAGIDFDKIDYILLREFTLLHQETFKILGIPLDKVIFVCDHPHFICDKLYVTSNVENYDKRYDPGRIEVGRWICEFLRDNIKSSQLIDASGKRRVYISRAKAEWRKILNEDDVVALLKEHGFEIFFFEEMNLNEKVKILAESECVVSNVGAALAQIPFCRPGTRVIVLYPSGFPCGTEYWTTCCQGDLEHYHLMCEDSRTFFPRSQDVRMPNQIDILVNIDELARTLALAGV